MPLHAISICLFNKLFNDLTKVLKKQVMNHYDFPLFRSTPAKLQSIVKALLSVALTISVTISLSQLMIGWHTHKPQPLNHNL